MITKLTNTHFSNPPICRKEFIIEAIPAIEIDGFCRLEIVTKSSTKPNYTFLLRPSPDYFELLKNTFILTKELEPDDTPCLGLIDDILEKNNMPHGSTFKIPLPFPHALIYVLKWVRGEQLDLESDEL